MAKEPMQPKTATPPAPDNGAEPPLTPEERLQRYQAERKALMKKWGIVETPVLKEYPNGRRVADIELMAVAEWQQAGGEGHNAETQHILAAQRRR